MSKVSLKNLEHKTKAVLRVRNQRILQQCMGVAADTAERKIVGRNKIHNISLTTVVRGKVAACSIGGAVLNGKIRNRRKGKEPVR